MISPVSSTAGKLVSRNYLQNSSNIAFKNQLNFRARGEYDIDINSRTARERRGQLERIREERQNNEYIKEVKQILSKAQDIKVTEDRSGIKVFECRVDGKKILVSVDLTSRMDAIGIEVTYLIGGEKFNLNISRETPEKIEFYDQVKASLSKIMPDIIFPEHVPSNPFSLKLNKIGGMATSTINEILDNDYYTNKQPTALYTAATFLALQNFMNTIEQRMNTMEQTMTQKMEHLEESINKMKEPVNIGPG